MTARNVTKIFSATSLAYLLGGVALAMTSGCANNALHASYGQRHALVMAAQNAAHPARDPIVRGDESLRTMRKYYYILQGGSMMMSGGGMGGMMGGGMSGGSMGGMSGGSMGGMGAMMGTQSAGQYGSGSTANLSTAGVPPLR